MEIAGWPVEVVARKFKDPLWRLRNLYTIKDKNGLAIPFRPNWAQEDFLNAMWFLNIVLKSRQIGFTTVIVLFMLDAILWNPNLNARVIADSDAKAKEIFDDKVRFAFDCLPQGLQAAQWTEVESMHALKLSNGSSIKVGTSTRGLTEQYLLVTELGKISLDYPKKAQEIRTGAFNTVHPGNFLCVESTAKGRGGLFYDLVEQAKKARDEQLALTQISWKLHFYPWYIDSACRLTAADAKKVVISDEDREYFEKIETEQDVELELAQRAFYVEKAKTQGDKMKEEYPSTEEEPFEVPLEGTYFGKEMVRARKEGRLKKLPWMPQPVNAYFDLGHSDYTSIWLHQHVWPWNHFLRYYQNSGEKLAHYAAWLQRELAGHDAIMGTIYLPHDAASVHPEATKSYEEQIRKVFPGSNVVVVERPNDKYYDGIEMTRQVLPTCLFDPEGCKEGIRVLDNYRKQWNDLLGVWRNEPLHDWASHGADAFEQFARGFVAGAQKGHKRGQSGKRSAKTV